MKRNFKIFVMLIALLAVVMSVVSCGDDIDPNSLWNNATYKSDTTLGEGAKEISVKVTIEEKSIVLTIKTDKTTLSDALTEHNLVNDPVFFDTFNGVLADWNKDKAYWAFYVGGEYAQKGISETTVNGGEEFEFKYTK